MLGKRNTFFGFCLEKSYHKNIIKTSGNDFENFTRINELLSKAYERRHACKLQTI